MEYTISIVTLQTGKLYTMNTTNQPHNIKVGWPVFKRMLGPLQGRKFYGLQYGPSSSEAYRFGSTMLPEDTFDQFEKIDGPAGLYASVRLAGADRLDHIGPAFEALRDVYETTIDSTRPLVEYYSDDHTVDVLLPIQRQRNN